MEVVEEVVMVVGAKGIKMDLNTYANMDLSRLTLGPGTACNIASHKIICFLKNESDY